MLGYLSHEHDVVNAMLVVLCSNVLIRYIRVTCKRHSVELMLNQIQNQASDGMRSAIVLLRLPKDG